MFRKTAEFNKVIASSAVFPSPCDYRYKQFGKSHEREDMPTNVRSNTGEKILDVRFDCQIADVSCKVDISLPH